MPAKIVLILTILLTSAKLSPQTEHLAFFGGAIGGVTTLVSVCDVAWFFMARRVVYAFGHLGHLLFN